MNPLFGMQLHYVSVLSNKLVSQWRVVAKSKNFWQATGQSNLEDKRLAGPKVSKLK